MYARPVYILSCFSLGENPKMKPEKSVTVKRALMWLAVFRKLSFVSSDANTVHVHLTASDC